MHYIISELVGPNALSFFLAFSFYGTLILNSYKYFTCEDDQEKPYYRPQTNSRHREEETQKTNSHMTTITQTK